MFASANDFKTSFSDRDDEGKAEVKWDDAVTIVGMIVNGWPGGEWDEARLESYANDLLSFDAELTTKAVIRARKKLIHRPSIAELIEFIQIERRLTQREQADFVSVEKIPKPLWVERWGRARAAGDWRPFPEQLHAMDMLARRSPLDYRAYAPPECPVTDASAWVQPSEYLDESLPEMKL
jgi:hypothetical protein